MLGLRRGEQSDSEEQDLALVHECGIVSIAGLGAAVDGVHEVERG